MDAVVYRWDERPVDRPMALLERKRIIGEEAMISEVHLSKGCDVPMHSHVNEQMACIIRGALRFGIGATATAPAREVVVRAGEVMVLPSGVPHSAYAEEDTVVWDVFSPPSEKTGIDAAGR